MFQAGAPEMFAEAVSMQVTRGRVYATTYVAVQGVVQLLRSSGTREEVWFGAGARAKRDGWTQAEMNDLLSVLSALGIAPPSQASMREAMSAFNRQMDRKARGHELDNERSAA